MDGERSNRWRSYLHQCCANKCLSRSWRYSNYLLYLHLPNGYGRSKLSNESFEKKLGVAATTRNWRTVTALAELLAAKGDS